MLNLNAVMAVIADVPAVVVRCFLSHRNAFIAAQSTFSLNTDKYYPFVDFRYVR